MTKENIESIARYRDNCNQLLAWIESNFTRLEGLNWCGCHIYLSVDITLTSKPGDPTAREIARRWPGRVWIRTKSFTACGVIDWVSKAEGELPIKIVAAEVIKWTPEPNTEVTT
jgi:hypothetical protein